MLACLSCSKKFLKLLYKIKKFPLFWGAIPKKKLSLIPSYPFELSYCKHCGLVQQTKLLDEKIINKVYTAEYYNCPSPIISGMGVSEIEKFIKFFKSCRNKPGKILEIACFDGYLLTKLQNLKWNVYGCDPGSTTNIAVKILGKKRIKKVFFKKGVYPNGSFDAVVFRNLLEHIYDPNKFLKEVGASLKSGGKIFIDVPNLKEIIKLGGFGLFFHQHVTNFTIDSINTLLIRNGFKITNYFEGKPNLFVEATKMEKIKSHKLKNKDTKILKKLTKKSKLKNKKALQFFENKKVKKLVIFGTSALATTLIGILNKKQRDKIILVVDNDLEKQGKYLSGSKFQIKSPKEIKKTNFDIVFVTTHFFIKEIKKNLNDMGVPNYKIKNI